MISGRHLFSTEGLTRFVRVTFSAKEQDIAGILERELSKEDLLLLY